MSNTAHAQGKRGKVVTAVSLAVFALGLFLFTLYAGLK